ncbi:hypothetical protein NI17_002425 [Thermobifida halotolerans]|uniref:Uncharacterized protein n=1 Tax=Thermobifida halotolerans TaxID=483545 RepID=A0A399G126_9ACTN|nr:hypothetical protein [Thermobifida halotolerans]UOE20122.1 hypothetical protein NI17_002425 [Thermobifida halotolerans]
MGFLRALLGRSRPRRPNLDQLFALPSATVTLRAVAGLTPTGAASVAFRAAEGQAFAALQQEITDLLNADEGPEVEAARDEYGYTWLVVRAHSADDLTGLVTDLHAVNSSLESAGFGPSLLCSLVVFADPGGRRVALVYLYKRGTFYPFAPQGAHSRNNALELQVSAALGDELAMEPDKSRWFPVYGAPGL